MPLKGRSVPNSPPTLGSLLRGLRAREGWTLKEMSVKSGIPVSTLSKIEHDRLTLSYDKLQSLGQKLGLRMSELFAEGGEDTAQAVTARRSLSDITRSVRVETPNYDYYYLCTELRRKRMIPVITKIRARSAEQFGDLVHHSGEEFIYVLSGKIVVQTEFYDPVTLEPGQALYIDSSMGHAYLAAEDCDEAEVLGVMSSADETLMESMLTIHEEQRQNAAHATGDAPSDRRPSKFLPTKSPNSLVVPPLETASKRKAQRTAVFGISEGRFERR